MSEKLSERLEALAVEAGYEGLPDDKNTLREAAAALRAVEGDAWQPIATAPKDGTFLVYMPNERTKIQVAKWHPKVNVIGNVFAFDLTAPTHWHPLPAAPLDAADGAEGV